MKLYILVGIIIAISVYFIYIRNNIQENLDIRTPWLKKTLEISQARKKDPTSIPPKKVLAGHSQWLDYNRVSHKNKGEDYKLTTKTVKTPPKSDSEVDALKQKCKTLTKCEDIDGSKTALGGCGFCHNTKITIVFVVIYIIYFLLGKVNQQQQFVNHPIGVQQQAIV